MKRRPGRAADCDRCRAAGIPNDVARRPKWKIALKLIDRARTTLRVPLRFTTSLSFRSVLALGKTRHASSNPPFLLGRKTDPFCAKWSLTRFPQQIHYEGYSGQIELPAAPGTLVRRSPLIGKKTMPQAEFPGESARS
jgi:hypothetical protein